MSVILVVDDVPICREAIVEILRGLDHDVITASNGEEALAVLDNRAAVDLVLLDVVMPRMDGLTVLRAIRDNPRWRGLPVILLTDVAEAGTVRLAAALGVRAYLLKTSFKRDELVARVNQHLRSGGTPSRAAPTPVVPAALATASTPPASVATSSPADLPKRGRDDVLTALRRFHELRPVPPVLHCVLSQTSSTETGLREVVATVRQDQALALRVMKVAGSTFYGEGKRVSTLAEAAARIGMAGIRSAVATVGAIDHFAVPSDTGLIPQRFWEHSLATAALAQSVGEALAIPDCEELFLAGLLHDIGRLALSATFPKDYRGVCDAAASCDEDLDVFERRAFGIGHAEATKEVLSSLSVPARVISAATLHGRPVEQLRQGDQRGALVVALANRLAHALALGDSGNRVLLATSDHAKALGLSAAALRSVAHGVVQRLLDQELYFACHGEDTFREPLRNELLKSRPTIRTAVLSAHAPADCLSIFFDQLGWLDAGDPQVVVVDAPTAGALKTGLADVAVLEGRTGVLPGVVVVAGAGSRPDGAVLPDRACKVLAMPLRYESLMQACAEVIAGSDSESGRLLQTTGS